MQYLYATLFPQYYSRNNKFGIQNKSLVDLTYKDWIFNIKEPSPPLQKFFLLPPKNNNKKKNIETNKAKEKMNLKQERKRKKLENKKINLEKKLKTNSEEMKKIKCAEKKLPVYRQ